MLRIKLQYLPDIIAERQAIAKKYLENIKNPLLILPKVRENAEHVYHQFVVRVKQRDHFREYLKRCGIETVIHYPIPPHLAGCYQSLGYKKGNFPIAEKYAGEVLSLPIFNGMTEEEIQFVIKTCCEYSYFKAGVDFYAKSGV